MSTIMKDLYTRLRDVPVEESDAGSGAIWANLAFRQSLDAILPGGINNRFEFLPLYMTDRDFMSHVTCRTVNFHETDPSLGVVAVPGMVRMLHNTLTAGDCTFSSDLMPALREIKRELDGLHRFFGSIRSAPVLAALPLDLLSRALLFRRDGILPLVNRLNNLRCADQELVSRFLRAEYPEPVPIEDPPEPVPIEDPPEPVPVVRIRWNPSSFEDLLEPGLIEAPPADPVPDDAHPAERLYPVMCRWIECSVPGRGELFAKVSVSPSDAVFIIGVFHDDDDRTPVEDLSGEEVEMIRRTVADSLDVHVSDIEDWLEEGDLSSLDTAAVSCILRSFRESPHCRGIEVYPALDLGDRHYPLHLLDDATRLFALLHRLVPILRSRGYEFSRLTSLRDLMSYAESVLLQESVS